MVKVYYNVFSYTCPICGNYVERRNRAKPFECVACETAVCTKCAPYGLCPKCATSHTIIKKIFRISTIVCKCITWGSWISIILLTLMGVIFQDPDNHFINYIGMGVFLKYLLYLFLFSIIITILDKWFKSMVGISVGDRDKRKRSKVE